MRVQVQNRYSEMALARVQRLLEQGATVDLQIPGFNTMNERSKYEKALRAAYGERLVADVSPWQALYKLS